MGQTKFVSMSEDQVLARTKAWEAEGYSFIGNGFENNEDDPNYCPFCGGIDIFWALWEHSTERIDPGPDGGYQWKLCNSANHCYECDARWIDEEWGSDYGSEEI